MVLFKLFLAKKKFSMVNLSAPIVLSDRLHDVVQHLMIDDEGDEMMRNVRLIEQAMNFNQLCAVVVGA